MSAPESIFLTTGIQGPTQNTSAESLDNKTNAANAALFVSIMEQYAPSQSSKMEPWAARLRAAATGDQSDLTGKNLPALPEDLPLIGDSGAGEGAWWGAMVDGKVVRAPWVSDAALEEFAVDLGIDRSLAQLLLRETTAAAADLNLASEGDSGETVAVSAAGSTELTAWSAATARLPSEELPSIGLPTAELVAHTDDLNGVDGASRQGTAPERAGLGALSGASAVNGQILPTLNPRANPPGNVNALAPLTDSTVAESSLSQPDGESGLVAQLGAESPLADEDVLRWRAASARSGPPESAFKPLGIEAFRAPEAVSTRTSSTTVAEATRTAMPSAIETSNTLANGPSASVAILPSVGLFGKDGLARKESLGSKEISASIKAIQVESSILPESIDVESLGEVLPAPLSSDTWLSLSASSLRQQSEAPAPSVTTTGAWINTSTVGAPAGSLNILDPATVLGRPLPLPANTLDYDTRVEQFAEQVGQRLIQQMRAERWTVSLQLDPQNLGPLDIALEIDGADVRATLAVMNPEVRALLDAGMPRLRDTLEAAGYQLSGWSLADSAGRDAAAQQHFAQGEVSRGAYGAARKQGLDDRELGAGVVPQGLDHERGIDLYV
jgi:flagellar hook-length control protein FliK